MIVFLKKKEIVSQRMEPSLDFKESLQMLESEVVVDSISVLWFDQ